MADRSFCSTGGSSYQSPCDRPLCGTDRDGRDGSSRAGGCYGDGGNDRYGGNDRDRSGKLLRPLRPSAVFIGEEAHLPKAPSHRMMRWLGAFVKSTPYFKR